MAMVRVPWFSPSGVKRAVTWMLPCSVNFNALPTRLVRICRKACWSTNTRSFAGNWLTQASVMPFCLAKASKEWHCNSMSCERSVHWGTTWYLPDSILSTSRILPISPSNDWAVAPVRAIASFRCAGLSSELDSNSTKPTIELTGVRNSWLILARKRLLALVASIALFFSFSSSWDNASLRWSCSSSSRCDCFLLFTSRESEIPQIRLIAISSSANIPSW